MVWFLVLFFCLVVVVWGCLALLLLVVEGLLFSGFDFSFEAFYAFCADCFVPLAHAFDYLGKVVFEFFL